MFLFIGYISVYAAAQQSTLLWKFPRITVIVPEILVYLNSLTLWFLCCFATIHPRPSFFYLTYDAPPFLPLFSQHSFPLYCPAGLLHNSHTKRTVTMEKLSLRLGECNVNWDIYLFCLLCSV